MKPFLEKVSQISEKSFALKEDFGSDAYFPWHYHPEYELTYVVTGNGKRFMGDHIGQFSDGDLILIGPDLPHFYKYDDYFYKETDLTKCARTVVLHFHENFLGKEFFHIPEMRPTREMLGISRRGIHFFGQTARETYTFLMEMFDKNNLDRLILLFTIFNILTTSKEYKILSGPSQNPYNQLDIERLNKIYIYLFNNFRKEINQNTLAELINMTPTSFSRYFKRRTHKTFIEVLNELRLGHACKLLIETDLTICQISYESGFNNLANFNRQFKSNMKVTPQNYRVQFRNNIHKTTAY